MLGAALSYFTVIGIDSYRDGVPFKQSKDGAAWCVQQRHALHGDDTRG